MNRQISKVLLLFIYVDNVPDLNSLYYFTVSTNSVTSSLWIFPMKKNPDGTAKIVYLFIETYLFTVNIISSLSIFHNHVPCGDFVI